MMQEIWKYIDGFDNNYSISNMGAVRNNRTNKILKYDKGRYLRVTLSLPSKTSRFLVHRLVALHFISNPKNKKIVNHIDGDKYNNTVENLEWATSQENERHSYDHLGKINNRRKKVINEETGEVYDSLTIAAERLNEKVGTLSFRIIHNSNVKPKLNYV